MNAVSQDKLSLDFRDSQLSAVHAAGADLRVILSAAHVHDPAGCFTQAPEETEGYLAPVVLLFRQARWQGDVALAMGRLADAELRLAGQGLRGLPLPFAPAGPGQWCGAGDRGPCPGMPLERGREIHARAGLLGWRSIRTWRKESGAFMSFFWVVVSVIFQLGLAFMLFLLVAFSSAGIANGAKLSPMTSLVLDASLYVLPLLCFVSAWMLVQGYRSGASAHTYWWHLLPIPPAIAYLVFAISLSGSSGR